MVYKIISIHPGADEFRYYNSKQDAVSGRTPIRTERKIGSKGANCAICLSSKGAKVEYYTIGRGEYDCDSYLSSEYIKIIRTVTKAPERLNVKLVYPSGDVSGMIEQNGRMGRIFEEEKREFFSSVSKVSEKSDPSESTFIFTGSLPTNVENSEYLGLISQLSGRGEYVVLDAGGGLISRQSENFASLIKPNRDEFHEMTRNIEILKSFQQPVEKSGEFYTEYLRYALKYVEKYGTEVLLTLGEAGLVYASPNEHYIKRSEPERLAYPAGMGDNLLASYLYYKRSEGIKTSVALDLAMKEALNYGRGDPPPAPPTGRGDNGGEDCPPRR